MPLQYGKRVVVHNGLAHFMESKVVHTIIAILIVMNTIIIGMMTYYDKGDPTYELLNSIDHIILSIFGLEIVLRILGNRLDFFKHAWNLFDFIIIFGAILPLGFSSEIARSFRVLRLFYFVEISAKMRHILRGLFIATPGILNVFFLLFIVFLIYSIIGASHYKHPGLEYFQNLGASIHTMFQVLTGDDWSSILHNVEKEFPLAWIFFYSFYIIMVFIVLNLCIGVVVGALQSAEEELIQESRVDEEITLDHILIELAELKKAVLEQNKKLNKGEK